MDHGSNMDAQVSHLIRVLRTGSQTGQNLCDRLKISRPTLSRLMEDCQRAHPGFLCRIGAARSTRYAWAKTMEDAADQPWAIPVHHVDRQGALQAVGTLTVLEADEYLLQPNNDLARRFPNGWIRTHYEGIPWFLQDIRPQGYLGRALAQRLFGQSNDIAVASNLPEHIHQWNDDQVLQVISRAGDDLPGNFLVGDLSAERFLHQQRLNVHAEDRPVVYARRVHDLISGQWIPHSSAGGEQPKFTACVTDSGNNIARQVIVKFSPPIQDLSIAAQRWRDLLLAESHALSVLTRHGFSAANTNTLQGSDGRWFLESTRFDRIGQYGRAPVFSLRSIILEAAGDLPGWIQSAEMLHSNAHIDAITMEQVFLLDAYGHFIGNTDRHPWNLSFTLTEHANSARFVLAPAYDMLPMQYAPDAQGSMVPGFRTVAPYFANHDMVPVARDLAMLFWSDVANDQRISQNFREMAMTHAESCLMVTQHAASHPYLDRAFHNGTSPRLSDSALRGTPDTEQFVTVLNDSALQADPLQGANPSVLNQEGMERFLKRQKELGEPEKTPAPAPDSPVKPK